MSGRDVIWVNGELVPRTSAHVSVLDASFQSGDSVWEGLRVYAGTVFRLSEHLERLAESAMAVQIPLPDRQKIISAVYEVVEANRLFDDCHVRLIVSRGQRRTSGMDPRNIQTGPTVVIIAEHKPVAEVPRVETLATSQVRRPTPATLDPSIHHSNQLNSILARLDAYERGADAALMLDVDGYVAEADTATVFAVIHGQLVTPALGTFIRGITRRIVIDLARERGFECMERRVALSELYAASEVFLTGTICELVPVGRIDGRQIGNGEMGPVCVALLRAYRDTVRSEAVSRKETAML